MCTATVNRKMEEIGYKFFDKEDPNFQIFIEKKTHMNLAHLKHEFI